MAVTAPLAIQVISPRKTKGLRAMVGQTAQRRVVSFDTPYQLTFRRLSI